jgi:homogentisate 1,2-dioxygenase
MESNFMPINPKVHVSPTQLAWLPFDIPTEEGIDFISGLKTLAGSGEPTLKEGIATHVYTAKSRDPTAPLADFLIFSPRWDVASNTYRPPYYHRNVATELMGLIYGGYGGRSDSFQPGGISFECGMVPHGVAYEEFKAASAEPPPVMQISKGAIAFMFESSRPFTVTDYAWNQCSE